ncbi:MAG TPA: DUF1622 domain-containing protein [Actinomycetes bacterium]|jgi:uncharacterized membrane protein|nr:DUF1622 domain-containing protein [Actinomycetes bacterium]
MDDVFTQDTLVAVIDVLVRLIEAAGALVIFVGAVLAFVRFIVFAVRDRRTEFLTPIRLSLARYLTLGLEFQLAGDILRTAIAPTFQEIGQLAAIAAIRTALNYFVGREIRQERAEIEAQAAAENRS